MKDIDLTKCANLRYRAKVDGNNDYGRICVENGGLVFLRSDSEDDYVAVWHCDDPAILGISERKVTDFELVPRDPETYQDWQAGDVIGSIDEYGKIDDVVDNQCRVIFRSGELVAIAENYEDADINGVYTCSQIYREGWRLVLTDIEQQIIEEKKKYEPKDGDVVAWKDKEDDGNPAVSIYKEGNRGYATIFANGLTEYSTYATFAMNIVRPATDEEKQRLFDAMSKEGKRWNAEKKVVEDIPKPYEFKKGEPVLVRTDYGRDWVVSVYVENSSNPDAQFGKYGVTGGRSIVFYRFCIPYNERTMHLLGTSEDYKEE